MKMKTYEDFIAKAVESMVDSYLTDSDSSWLSFDTACFIYEKTYDEVYKDAYAGFRKAIGEV